MDYSLSREPTLPEVPSELSDVRIHLPKEWSKSENGYEVKLEFFQEEYALGEFIQYRITVTNHTDKTIIIPEIHDLNWFPGAFLRSDGKIWGLDVLNSPEPVRGDGKDPMEVNGPWAVDADKSCALLAGSSATQECVFVADPSFFIAGGKYYTYEFKGSFHDFAADGSRFEYAIPVEVTGTAATVKTTKTYKDWRIVTITDVANLIELPELNPPDDPYATSGGGTPFFCGEVVEVTVDYLVVKPDATMVDVRYSDLVSYAEELLKHGETYIVPLATQSQGAIAVDTFSVGDAVCVRFRASIVGHMQEFSPAPVVRHVYYCEPLQTE